VLAVADVVVEICIIAVQLHGGYGYISEYPVERLLRDALSARARLDLSVAL
jgi:alkylation response protein AidB-like acyl-CoA dehydrogenase